MICCQVTGSKRTSQASHDFTTAIDHCTRIRRRIGKIESDATLCEVRKIIEWTTNSISQILGSPMVFENDFVFFSRHFVRTRCFFTPT